MLDQFSRTQLLYGRDAMTYFASCRIAVFGIGGVGGYVVEALARSGIGALDLIDDDKICVTNINRQILATRKTVGKYKVDIAEERIKEINPDCEVRTYKTFYLPDTQDQFDFHDYDYVVDAIDTVTGKLAIIENAKKADVPVISAMGAGNKLDPAAFEVADIYDTSICPLAKVMRHECRKRGIDTLKVVYSKEMPVRPLEDMSVSCRQNCICPPGTARKCTERRDIPGSTAFVPAVAGLIIAGEIINDLEDFFKSKNRTAER
ncbi:MAG: tRNA threonylcarbamoyladenosine dehydratase [Lachnospiraceae bacterium]|nr:tRNA threonylcarbamoyladenosine dehydratase [Lachnospiraceae bacterium]